MTQAPTTLSPDAATPAAVLEAVSASRAARDAEDARILLLAVGWADLHPAEAINTTPGSADGWFGDRPVRLAGTGTPEVSEFCLAELAAALGVPTEVGRALLAEALELRHRLPRLWARVHRGLVPAWRARRVARHTITLPPAAAAYVDDRVASYAHKVGPAAVDRLVEEALTRFDAEAFTKRRRLAAKHRHVTVDLSEVSGTGTVQLSGELDLADGLDLDHTLSHRARQLAAAGSTCSLDERRATALGELARGLHPLALTSDPSDSRPDGSAVAIEPGAVPPGRDLVLHVHLSESALTGSDGVELARVESTRSFVTADQVRGWCADPTTRVTVRPVIDLAEQISVDAYEIPDRLAEQIRLRDHTCVFPWCRRSARGCDLDHITPYTISGPPGQTCTGNLAALCRHHHRLKTFAGWTYSRTGPATYLWTSPHGHHYRRDHTGTIAVDRRDASEP